MLKRVRDGSCGAVPGCHRLAGLTPVGRRSVTVPMADAEPLEVFDGCYHGSTTREIIDYIASANVVGLCLSVLINRQAKSTISLDS